jgi:hypothetical protein
MAKYINPHTRRYLISLRRAFIAGFVASELVILPLLKAPSDLTTDFIMSALFAGVIGGLVGVLKFIDEKREGRI